MVDLDMVDEWFEAGYRRGNLVHFGLFDRRVLLPWEQMADRFYLMTGQNLTLEDLTSLRDRGWIPLLNDTANPEGGIGIPMYADSRMELLRELERNGYSASELQSIAKWKEDAIDSCLAVDDLAYIDDDLELMINHMKCRILQADLGSMSTGIGDSPGKLMPLPRERYERRLRMYEQFQRTGIPGDYQYDVAKAAFRVRAINEIIRVEILEIKRAKIRAGYSPYVVCRSEWRVKDKEFLFNARLIHWDLTIESAIGHAGDDTPTIRVPGFFLH